MWRKTYRERRAWIWAAVLLAVGAGLCAVPLFDLLGFEFSFVVGIAAAVAGAHLGAQAVWRTRRDQSRADGERADARPLAALAGIWARTTFTVWAMLALPLACVTLNALRVRNCNFSGGLLWYGILPLPSAACGAAAGVCAGLLRSRRRIFATLAALAIVLASLGWAAWRFYAAPPIFAYDPFGGYFPGTLYDEEVAIAAPLVWARVYHLTAAAAALALAALFLDGNSLRLRLSAARDRLGVALAALALSAAALVLHASGARLGFQLDANDLARALGAEKQTEHFVLHYSPAGPFAKDIELYAADHEQRWSELAALFGVTPAGRVHSFLFDSTAQKQSLMGAAHTSIAKPWRREIYLQNDGWPHPVLKHELAHVFAGAFGDPIFHAARRDLRFNVGLIEGVATAAAWSGSPLTPHESVAVARALGTEPPLDGVFSLDFLRYNGSTAYSAAGSFCRFLIDRSGAAPLEAVYRAGGAPDAWQAAYGVPFAALRAEWSRFIDGVKVDARERELARERLQRPSVFHKVCAHELALRRDAARRAAAAGDRASAIADLRAVCADDPDEPQNLVEVMDVQAAGGPPLAADAAATAARLLAHPKVSPAQRARAHVLLGDQALERRDLAAARAHYAAAQALPLDESEARLTTVKLLAVAEPPGPIADALIHFLVQPAPSRDAALDLLALGELVHDAPERGLFHYLLGRQLAARGRHEDAARELDVALERGLPDARFRREALRLRGIALCRVGRRYYAHEAFQRLLDEGAPEGQRLEALDWIARCSE